MIVDSVSAPQPLVLAGRVRIDVAAAYAIGTLAAYWLIERTIGFWA